MFRKCHFAILIGLPLMALACLIEGSAPAQAQIAALVNGEPITNSDIEQRTKLIALSSQRQAARKDVLEELINDKVKIKEAKKFGLELSPSDTESAFANMGSRMNMNAEQFSKMLESRGVRPETLKTRLKADVIWTQLVRGRFQQSLMVGEKDVLSAIETKGSEAAPQEGENFEYQLRAIVLIVARNAESSVRESRRREAEALRGRIQSCEQAVDVFRGMRDATIREPTTRTSADIPAPLRATLDKLPVGQLTQPEVTKQGIEMVALCGRKVTTADTPQKRQAREKLFAEKFEARAAQYLKDIRRGSMIEYR